jgi:hypothetical protein
VHGLRLGVRNVSGSAAALVAGTTLTPESSKPDADGYLWYALPPVEAFEAISLTNAK